MENVWKIILVTILTILLNGCGGGSSEEDGVATYDLERLGVPKFVSQDFTQLYKVKSISLFRSAYGHDYSDATEECRSMKHYYAPKNIYRKNDEIEIYSPIDGVIESIQNEHHGSSDGLKNKEVRIQSTQYPAFSFTLFHCDLIDDTIVVGKEVHAGELIAHARMVYPDLNETANDFDISVWVQTPDHIQYVSYFETMTDTLFSNYQSRGVTSRDEMIISKSARDADPLTCNGQQFTNTGSLPNWKDLN